MQEFSSEKARLYGFAILINRFEPLLRAFLSNEILSIHYGDKWLDGVPRGVVESAKEKSFEKIQMNTFNTPSDLMESVDFSHLKEISIYKNNFSYCGPFYGSIKQEQYCESMDTLYELRNKIAHANRNFSMLDLDTLIELVLGITKGKLSEEFRDYINKQEYLEFKEIPKGILLDEQDSKCISNLPSEDYDLEGGFVGRRQESKKLKKLLYSDLDRIITITGGGGVGKTAFALKTAYSVKYDRDSPFSAIIWFSAKTSRLSYEGIVELEPQIKNLNQLMKDILKVLSPDNGPLIQALDNTEKIQQHLFDTFSTQKILLIIDNLETIINDNELIDFIKDIPRPTTVLITSRKGLGEVERRFPLEELTTPEAIVLFRYISRDKNLMPLVKLDDTKIEKLVNKVQNYPLAIKWTLGQVSLGKEIDEAFNSTLQASSDIARFCFEDIFSIINQNAKICLYGVSLFDEPPSRSLLKYLVDLDDETFDDAIKELILASFIFPVPEEVRGRLQIKYSTLSLTRDFVLTKLEGDKSIKLALEGKFNKMQRKVEQVEKSYKEFTQSDLSFDIKLPEDKIAVMRTKEAQLCLKQRDYTKAEKLFKEAVSVAPTFAYSLITYARFEADRKHYVDADTLMKQAASTNPQNFHIWYSWGMMKRRQNEIEIAEQYLLKAKQLQPENQSLNNDLGRVYCFQSKYEEAEDCFKKASNMPKHINYRNKLINYIYRAENFRRWHSKFSKLRNYEEASKKLADALKYIQEALVLDPYDKSIYDLKRQIYLDAGIDALRQHKLKSAETLFETCTNVIQFQNMKVEVNREIAAAAYYYISSYALREKEYDKQKIEDLINKGLSIVPYNSEYKLSLENLLSVNNNEKKSRQVTKEHVLGRIKSFNESRHFGILESDSKTYLFLLNAFGFHVDRPSDLIGKEAYFIPEPSKKREGTYVATKIILKE